MDDEFKGTLTLIESIAVTLPTVERGNQLIHVVKDYINDGDNQAAIRALGLIEQDYFDTHMYVEAIKNSLLSDAIATIIEVLGLGFSVLARPRTYVC